MGEKEEGGNESSREKDTMSTARAFRKLYSGKTLFRAVYFGGVGAQQGQKKKERFG